MKLPNQKHTESRSVALQRRLIEISGIRNRQRVLRPAGHPDAATLQSHVVARDPRGRQQAA